MPYSYDTDRAPLEIDSRRMDLDDQAEALRAAAQTHPMGLTPWLGDKSPAPRVPRLHRLAGVDLPGCSGECQQGRGRCASPTGCVVPRLEPIGGGEQGAGRALIWLLCLSVLLCMGAAIWAGVEWADVISLLAAIGGAL